MVELNDLDEHGSASLIEWSGLMAWRLFCSGVWSELHFKVEFVWDLESLGRVSWILLDLLNDLSTLNHSRQLD